MSKCTIRQVAALAGVSPATVSRVLSGSGGVSQELRSKVVSAARESGYISRKPNGRRYIGLIVPDLKNPFYNEIIQGVMDTAALSSCGILLWSSSIGSESSSPPIFTSDLAVDGVISTQLLHPDSLIFKSMPKDIPLVQCCEYNEELPFPIVSIDNYASAYNAVSHLINLGRRSIAFFGSSSASMYTVLREQGFRDAMADYGLPVNEAWVLHLGDVDYNLAVSAADHLFSQSDCPDAVFAVSDMYAAGVTRSARKLGFAIPDDVSVVGFDDTDVAKINEPPLTTIRQPSYKMGCFACSMLLQLISTGSTPSRKVILESELIVRDSSRAKAPMGVSGGHREQY